MKLNNIKLIAIALLISLTTFNCSDDDEDIVEVIGPDFSGVFVQEDQVARPAVNTVFVSSNRKDEFNVTIPSQQNTAFQAEFQANLEALSPAFNNPGDLNLLQLDAATFTGVLATDVLTVDLDGPTTFFDGTNVLTGRALADDVVTVEFILIFGGEDGTENNGENGSPLLNDDNIDANDVPFLTSFPYLAAPHN